MKYTKGKKKAIILLSICIALSLCGIVFGAIKIVAGNSKESIELHQTDQVILEGDGTQTLLSKEDAFQYLADNADAFGITDAENTLAFKEESGALGNHYYNYNQVYKDIPVYGNQLIVMTDSDGTVLMSSGVYKAIDDNVDITPSVTKDKLKDCIKDYLTSVIALTNVTDVKISGSLSEDELVIFAQDAAADVLAYEFDVSFSSDSGADSYHVIADANTGEVLSAWSNVVTDSQTVKAKDLSTEKTGVYSEINVYQDTDGLYYMYDEKRNIAVYDADEKEVKLKDSIPTSASWKEVAQRSFQEPRPQIVVSKNSRNWDEEAVTLMNQVAMNYDWYKVHLGITGFNNENGLVMANYNDVFDNGNNARSWGAKVLKYTCLSYGFKKDITNMDLIAHEYGHSVQKAVVDLSNSGETGSIMEAYADTMGEIVEGDSSWKHSTGRNIANPNKSKNPSKIKGRYYKSIRNPKKFNESNDWGYVHKNSTILSHASYLMYMGINGDKTRNLNNLQIAHLWYLTIKNIPKYDISFQEFGTLMRITAKTLAKIGILKSEQYECVIEALKEVGIVSETSITLNVKNNCEYSLKDFYGADLDDATVKAYEIYFKEGFAYPGDDVIEEVTTGDDGGVQLSVEDGKYYRMVISDNKNPEEPEYELQIGCSSSSKIESLDINTTFRSDVVTGFEFEESEITLAVGEEGYIDSVVKPFGIYNTNWEIMWQTSDDQIAEVDEHTGTITGKGEGTAKIIATLKNKGNTFSQEGKVTVTKKQRDTVLVLDRSGSMWGTPLIEMKQSAINFCRTLLNKGDNQIEIISYDNSVSKSGFLTSFSDLEAYINDIYDGGTTNMYEALCQADYDFQNYARTNSIQNIVIMSDGIPNEGDIYPNGVMTKWCEKNHFDNIYSSAVENGNAVCVLADDLKEKYNIYSLGFFHSLQSDEKAYCKYLMKYIQNQGYYEVDEAENLKFTFDDISDEVRNGSKIVIRIACPVDVTVTCGKEKLSSSYANYQDSVSFGTLQRVGVSDDIKVVELDSDKEYQISLNGTGSGTMDYSVTYYDENDTISDSRKFENVPITANTQITTDATKSETTELTIDSDGDGEKDSVWTAAANEKGTETWKDETKAEVTPSETKEAQDETVKNNIFVIWVVLVVICSIILVISITILIILLVRKDKKAESVQSDNFNNQDIISSGIQMLSGTMRGIKIPMEDNAALKIGKDPQYVSVVIDKQFSGVSRVHCSVTYSARYNKYFITDCSTNGTYLDNGMRLRKGESTPVERQTVIYLAKKDCRIRLL